MEIEKTPLEGLLIVRPRVFEDGRGFFFESYNQQRFQELGLPTAWVQDNHARSGKNTLRGLHFQRGKGQAKLVRCLRGRAWDVAVDIRPGSPTLLGWHGLELTPENKKMLLVPEGFAHGYVALEGDTEVLYKCGTVYDPELEDEIRWDDPDVGVEWPVAEPLLSQRDVAAQTWREYAEKQGLPT